MKKTGILALVLTGFLMVSCGGNGKKKDQDNSSKDNEETSIGDAINAASSLKKMSDQADDMEKLQKKLSKMEPASHETIKKVLPKTLMGLDRKKYSISSNQMFGGLLTGEATYRKDKDNDHDIELSITDGAGKTGSSLLMMSIWGLRADMEEETESGFTKTVKRDGHRVKIEQKKYGKHIRTTMTFAINQRFLITLKGNNYTADELEKAYDELDFSPLKK